MMQVVVERGVAGTIMLVRDFVVVDLGLLALAAWSLLV